MNRCLLAIASFCIMSATVLSGCASTGQTPALQPIPTSTPSGTVSPSMSSISFSSTTAQSFTVSESGYTGSFTASSSDKTVATVLQTSSTTSARRRDTTTTTTFAVTPVGAGNATITVSDQDGNSATLPVTVTSATFTPESHT